MCAVQRSPQVLRARASLADDADEKRVDLRVGRVGRAARSADVSLIAKPRPRVSREPAYSPEHEFEPSSVGPATSAAIVVTRSAGLTVYGHHLRGLVDRAVVTAREQGLRAVALKTVRYPLKPLFVPAALTALQRRRRQIRSPEQLYDFVNGFNYRGIDITSWQKKAEIVSLLRLLEDSPPRNVVEIGTASGGTLFMLTQVAAADATIVSVDLPRGRLGGESSTMRNRYPLWRARLYRGFGRDDQIVHVIRADSHEASTVQDVQQRLPEGKIDFLFIDGDHSYEGVCRDFELYSPLVEAGGLVAFHDIVPSGPGKHGDPGGVPDFWSDLRTQHSVEAEFVEDWDWGSCGIGVISV